MIGVNRAISLLTSAASGLERILPRIDGIVQNAQFWLHPSLIRRYA